MIIRMMMESHLIGFICCLINIKRAEYRDVDNWSTINTYLSYCVLPIYVLFPIISVRYMNRNYENLGQSHEKVKYGELYEGYSLKRKNMLIFWSFQYIQKMVLGIVVVYFEQHFFI